MSLIAELGQVLPIELVNVVLAYFLDFECSVDNNLALVSQVGKTAPMPTDQTQQIVSLEDWVREQALSSFNIATMIKADDKQDSFHMHMHLHNPEAKMLEIKEPNDKLTRQPLKVPEFFFESGRTLQKELEICQMSLPCNLSLDCVSLNETSATLHLRLRGLKGKAIGPFVIILDSSFPRTSPRLCAVPSLCDIFGDTFAELQLDDFKFDHAWKSHFTCSLAILWIILCVCSKPELVNFATVHRTFHEQMNNTSSLTPYKPVFAKGITRPREVYCKSRPDPRVFAEVSDKVTQTYQFVAQCRDLTITALTQIGLAAVIVQIITSYRGIYPSELALSVFVKDIDAVQYPVRVLELMPLSELSVALERKWNRLPFRLVSKGLVLQLERTFLDYKMTEGDKIHVVSMFRGG